MHARTYTHACIHGRYQTPVLCSSDSIKHKTVQITKIRHSFSSVCFLSLSLSLSLSHPAVYAQIISWPGVRKELSCYRKEKRAVRTGRKSGVMYCCCVCSKNNKMVIVPWNLQTFENIKLVSKLLFCDFHSESACLLACFTLPRLTT